MERNTVMKPVGEWGALSDSGATERPLEPFPQVPMAEKRS